MALIALEFQADGVALQVAERGGFVGFLLNPHRDEGFGLEKGKRQEAEDGPNRAASEWYAGSGKKVGSDSSSWNGGASYLHYPSRVNSTTGLFCLV
ncbi:hypothetical protein GCM10028821_48360 [Hymenobacter jeollabukensis]